jgi:alkyl hydroperoxide reductase subunit AhpC
VRQRAWSAAIAALLVASPLAMHAQARVGYVVRALDGSVVRIGAGQPVTLVAVFATWCRTCRTEFATLDSLRIALAPRGVRVLALSVDEGDDARVQRWTGARRTGLLVAHDGSGAVSRTFGTVGVPESYLVDASGVVRWRGTGDISEGLATLRTAIGALRGAK